MEEVAFNDWPGQPLDLGSGGNSWLPAYGFQTPSALLERDDFLGNPDADYFLHGNSTPCLYLETIHEETSDDLRSDSDLSDVRASPLGWLATDSETDSVICMDATNETDCESDREIACPIKRRRQDTLLPYPPDDDYQSLSRSSSLLQFETLEKQCQETSSSSPSIYSQFSVDSLERPKAPPPASDSSDSGGSETTLAPSKSCSNLRTWRSFDNLTKNSTSKRDKISAENLSEDSGYSDHMMREKKSPKSPTFGAYDFCESFTKMGGKFGASCQNLNVVAGEWVNLEKEECGGAKYNSTSASEPNLVQGEHCDNERVSVCSVPKNLDLVGKQDVPSSTSIAAKNWDLADFATKKLEMASFKREGSYAEAMRNRVDLSDDESSLCYKKKIPKTTIVDFDRKVLQAISESIHSINSISIADAHLSNIYNTPPPIQNKRNVVSTPNLVMNQREQDRFNDMLLEEDRRRSVQDLPRDLPRKSSLVNHSTSTSCVSDVEERTLNYESGSTKGVHFSPVVSEVNWPDDSQSTPSTAERDSSYSLSSTPEREAIEALTKTLLDRRPPTPPKPNTDPPSILSESQPDLHRPRFRPSLSQSQPDIRLKRRGSQLVKKDPDGFIIKGYVDGDGVQYKHTHLDLDVQQVPPTSHVPSDAPRKRSGAVAGMEAFESPRKEEKQQLQQQDKQQQQQAKTKIGSFFSRLASFRLSLRKDDKNKKKTSGKKQESSVQPQQRVATKDDYIYIPLRDRTPDDAPPPSKPAHVLTKPPLPRAPPRVVGASVKKASHDHQENRRRRTIDSGVECPRPMEPMGLIETDLDTQVTVITRDENNVKTTRSLLNLGAGEPRLGRLHDATDGERDVPDSRPHKSMEFLLDKQNLKVVEPPENELQKGERVMSEQQLRVQRSLQKLTVPEWYRQAQVPREGFILRSRSRSREARWTGTGSRTTSLSSLASSNNQSPNQLSPSAPSGFVRWSTSRLNSTASSPCASARSSFNTRQPNGSLSPSSTTSTFSYLFRQPYYGWRSQERLSNPRTPAERLAQSLLERSNPQPSQHVQESPEIQSSIKEVTSAIVHYVSGLKPETADSRSRSASPRGSQKLCWLESSFVGTKPLDSPQTPITLNESQPGPSTTLRLDLQTHNDLHLMSTSTGSKPSPSSATLEDVLDSLLGLPASDRAPSPSLQATASVSNSPNHYSDQFRRSSDGSDISLPSTSSRRMSYQSPPVLQCKYSKCGRIVPLSSPEAANFRKCNNCSYTYCSRECRRAHWEKHRRTCLFFRIGNLCRQVIAAIKEQKETLYHLSSIARRGYFSHGYGALKIFFTSPEKAEKFLAGDTTHLGESTYIRWPDLLPSEMGHELHRELVDMCRSYNPNTKLVLYVAICVISEAPTGSPMKWERQLVSRCAKMRLSKDLVVNDGSQDNLRNYETLILYCDPIRSTENYTTKELKEISVNNVQKELRLRGVSLRCHHAVVLEQLRAYSTGTCQKFTPITVYPTDVNTGRHFMCIIMLEAEPETLRQVQSAAANVNTINVLCDISSTN